MKENLKPCAYKQSELVATPKNYVFGGTGQSDGVLFVERASELQYEARLST